MNKRVRIGLVVAVVASAVLLLTLGRFWGPSSAPPGQAPLTVLSTANLAQFTAAFDSASDVPRIVLLLSPT